MGSSCCCLLTNALTGTIDAIAIMRVWKEMKTAALPLSDIVGEVAINMADVVVVDKPAALDAHMTPGGDETRRLFPPN